MAAIQCKIGDISGAERLAKIAIEDGTKLILFPEYFTYDKFSLEITEITLKFLRTMSKEFDVTVSGNAIIKGEEGIFNRAFIFKGGELIGYQDKVHPTRTERLYGIKCGEKLNIFDLDGVKLAVLVCADILYPELCRVAALKGAEIALNPVVSFKKSELPGDEYRYCLYFTRAFDNCYAIVKAGGFGYTFTGSRAAGRSLIATFDGILAKSKSEDDEDVLTAEIDIGRIRKYRKLNYSLHDRNVKAYYDLLSSSFNC